MTLKYIVDVHELIFRNKLSRYQSLIGGLGFGPQICWKRLALAACFNEHIWQRSSQLLMAALQMIAFIGDLIPRQKRAG